ncbi:MAG: c-type cytochrome [Chloroflexi bacterium]|nr:c-type cytochrome [Chloroflexota bacterium]
MKVKSAWYLGGVLVLGLTVLAISCALIEPPVPPLPVPTISPPVIPHSLEGRADCRLCHEAGIGGAPKFPADHNQRPSDVCLTCHVEAPGKNGVTTPLTVPPHPVEITPTAVSAKELYGAKCAVCHGANRQGVTGLAPALTPESLATLSDTETRNAMLDGRPGTAMPGFKGALTLEEIDALLQFIKSASP